MFKQAIAREKTALMVDMMSTVGAIRTGTYKLSKGAKIALATVSFITVAVFCFCAMFGASFSGNVVNMLNNIYKPLLIIGNSAAALLFVVAVIVMFVAAPFSEKASGIAKKALGIIIIGWVALNAVGLIKAIVDSISNGQSLKQLSNK